MEKVTKEIATLAIVVKKNRVVFHVKLVKGLKNYSDVDTDEDQARQCVLLKSFVVLQKVMSRFQP